MPKVLIVSTTDLTPELGRTVLWRADIDRVLFATPDAGLQAARSSPPSLTIVAGDDVAAAAAFIERLRADPATRRTSVAVLSCARNLSLLSEEILRQAGANVVLSGQVDPLLWDARLEELLNVPRRCEARVPVHVEVWSRFSAERPSSGWCVNLSVRGMLLETVEPMDIGTKLDLSFRLPEDDEQLRAVGQVVREAAAVEGRPQSGLEFLILRGNARDRIRAFVDAQSKR